MGKECQAHEYHEQAHSTGYTTITPYLYAKVDLADFLRNAFGAEVTHTPTPDAEGHFHAETKIGDAHVLFGNGYFSDP